MTAAKKEETGAPPLEPVAEGQDLEPADDAVGVRRATAAAAERDVPISPFLRTKLRLIMWIAVVAVVFVHAYNLGSRALVGENAANVSGAPGVVGFIEYLVSQTLTRWPVAMFFAVSGFLFFRNLAPSAERYLAKYRRRARTIVLPYLLWSAWSLLVYVALHVLPGSDDYVASRALDRLDLGAVLERLFVHPVAYPLWFLQALVVCLLLAPVIAWLVRTLDLAALLPFAVPWLLEVDVGPGDYVEFKALLFFALGALIATRLRQGRRVPARGGGGASAALGRWLLPLFVIASVVFTTFLRDDTAWTAELLHKLLMCLALAAIWFGYDAYFSGLANRRWAMATSAFAFFVFVAREPLLMMLKRILLRAGGGPEASDAVVLALHFIAPLLTIALCLACGWALRRWARPAYALLTGGR